MATEYETVVKRELREVLETFGYGPETPGTLGSVRFEEMLDKLTDTAIDTMNAYG